MDDNFLLSTGAARALFHDVASQMPIIDYHCHLSARLIADHAAFDNLGEMMLGGDHYKWRLMHIAGVDEQLIRGDAPWKDKFVAYAGALEGAVGNPLYHWTHLELRRIFDIEEALTAQSAPSIYRQAGEQLRRGEHDCVDILHSFDVRVLCTTDDPVDDLADHKTIAADPTISTKVYPTFRPDKATQVDAPGFAAYARALCELTGQNPEALSGLVAALENRMDYFHAHGCRLSDHALGTLPELAADVDPDNAYREAMRGSIDAASAEALRFHILCALGRAYSRRGWTMQLHMSALRNVNSRGFAAFGPDTGFDSVGDSLPIARLAALLDAMDREGALPRFILYSLNPVHNAALAALIGAFGQSGVPGRAQFGSAWWFNDTIGGMREQLTTLAAMGHLGSFVGMLTDSRSFLSYPRHEYFRRILCAMLGEWVERGEYPNDRDMLESLVRGICYDNARRYFGLAME